MRNSLEYAWALISSFMLTLSNTLPAARTRRANSALFTVIIIIVIVVTGAAIIYLLVIASGPTTPTYP